MGARMPQARPAYAEEARRATQELRRHNSPLPGAAAAVALLSAVGALCLLDRDRDGLDGQVLAGLGALAALLFLAWLVCERRREARFAAEFYGRTLPSVLGEAYRGLSPRTGDPDPTLFDPGQRWRLPSTVTLLVLTASGPSFRAQGIYRVDRERLEADSSADADNDDAGCYRVSQDLVWKVRPRRRMPFRLTVGTASGTVGEAVLGWLGALGDRLLGGGMQDVRTGDEAFDRGFRARADDVGAARRFLRERGRLLAELRDNVGGFSLEGDEGTITLTLRDFAPIDTRDLGRTGLPPELDAERVERSARELAWLTGWLERLSREL